MALNDKRVYWIWLSLICGAASRRAVKILRHFGSAKRIFEASGKELLESGTLKENDKAYGEILKHDLSEAEDILKWCKSNGVDVYTPDTKGYPANLLSLRDAPLVLYVVGKLPDFEKECAIAVVGTRKMTDYGKRRAWSIGRGLAKGGAVVVSGIALGGDGMAMASTIEAGGVTVGVLGFGIDIIYPKEHRKLFASVIKNGAIVTEYAPGSAPTKTSFPQRNRIISALAQGTVVTEADNDSGALITARSAVFQGRDLFAVPGNVDAFGAEGTNQLIKEGAFAVTGAEDVLSRYEYVYPHKISISGAHRANALADGELGPDQVMKKYGVKTEFDRHNIYSRSTSSGAPIREETAEKTEDAVVTAKKSDIPKIRPETGAKKKKPAKTENKFENSSSEPVRIDFEMLGEKEKTVYNAMDVDTPMLPEEIRVPGYRIQDIMASLTLLEISGAVEAGAGGYFMRTSADDMDVAQSGEGSSEQ